MEHADWPDLGPVTFWPWREEGALLQPFGENGWEYVHTYELSQGSDYGSQPQLAHGSFLSYPQAQSHVYSFQGSN